MKKHISRNAAMMMATMMMAAASGNDYFATRNYGPSVNDYESPKVSGFTQVKGRRKLTKKQRKARKK